MVESPLLRNSLVLISVACTMKIYAIPSFLIGISKEHGYLWMIRKTCFGGNLTQLYTTCISLNTDNRSEGNLVYDAVRMESVA